MKPRVLSNIYSIFTSIQGEGLFVGVPQIFIRFTGCNIRCKYGITPGGIMVMVTPSGVTTAGVPGGNHHGTPRGCDTPEALTAQASARIEQTAFSGKTKLLPNPFSVETVTKTVRRLNRTYKGFHSIVLTGGEPLLSDKFLQRLLPHLKTTGLPLFLETNGTLPTQLNSVINLIDIISMDIKIPSSVSGKIEWGNVAKFLKIGTRKQIYVKVVVPKGGQDEEFIKVREIIRKINPNMPVILQPVSSYGPASFKRLLEIYRIFRLSLKDIRIIPQVHKLMGWS